MAENEIDEPPMGRTSRAVYQPGGVSFFGRWSAGYRALGIGIDAQAVGIAMARLIGNHMPG